MFDVGNHSEGEGGSDGKPIVLEGYKSEDFECLLKILLHQPLDPFPPALEKQEWSSVLKLATIWQMDKVRTLAIDRLSALELSPIEKIQHARQYHVSAWFKEGVVAIATNWDDYEMEEVGNTIGWKTTATIISMWGKAKPRAPRWKEWGKGWECPCGLGLSTGVTKNTKRQWLECSAQCGEKYIRTKQTVDEASDGPSAAEISEDVVSAAFAEEIWALDAYLAS
ncbi:hypothetical protein BKA70DRAFT_1280207 [Coprinopsis sp. MPI-PUGE-AT-0042]|nr:hypothetical protein BKA70DRAFT_1280207 [Coprinopsis sp. MPI-PUGE-AT-0042]